MGTKSLAPPSGISDDSKMTAKIVRYNTIDEGTDIINFKGFTLIKNQHGFYVRLTSDEFARIAYGHYPGLLMQQIKELEHRFRALAKDMTHLSRYITFGEHAVWDTRELEWAKGVDPNAVVFASQTAPNDDTEAAWKYILDLAVGDEALAWDILQGLAPLFMEKKPDGVIWFVGGGANGKSSLVNATYKIIGHHLSSMTVGAIEDGRDAPRLNGVLGNVCRESSEGKVEDSERYKAIGTHEPFEVHKFHSQDSITITGDLHHIFNANNIPIFSDKTEGARRRTLIIPFNNRFKSDPTFEEKTFTKEFLGGLLTLILEATHIIRENRYQYRFSDTTLGAKADYDSEVNSAEAFFEYLEANKVEAFSNYAMLKTAYENWCGVEGLVPLGITNLKRAMKIMGKAERKSVRKEDGSVTKWYFFGHSKTPPTDLVSLDNGMHVGLKTTEEEKVVPKSEQTKLGQDW